MGGLAEGALRLDRPTFEGEEPERDRGGVCTDIMARWQYSGVIELMREEAHCQTSCATQYRPGLFSAICLYTYFSIHASNMLHCFLVTDIQYVPAMS